MAGKLAAPSAPPGLRFGAGGQASGVVATAVARPGGQLRVDRWDLRRSGAALTTIGAVSSGVFGSLVEGSPSIVGAMAGTLVRTRGAAGDFYSAHRERGSNRLRVLRWRPS